MQQGQLCLYTLVYVYVYSFIHVFTYPIGSSRRPKSEARPVKSDARCRGLGLSGNRFGVVWLLGVLASRLAGSGVQAVLRKISPRPKPCSSACSLHSSMSGLVQRHSCHRT